MSLRERLMADLKTAMKAGESGRVSTIRMITAKLKDVEIAGRAKGAEGLNEDEAISALRGMVKSRTESATMYRDAGRPELAEKEDGEIAVIRAYLPAEMDDAALAAAVDEAIAATGAASMKDMGKVMAALKAKFGAELDMGRANGTVKARLS
ncbi:amidotransferase GatB/YqeY subunit [Acetobacter indonesiensis NRIC 0313]|uniref:Aspartyl-tRNA amidotransferase n=1 Tax=Acetobacter indonesiensis TaxID=104101 RepID=A0A252AWL4_9PROT|nr:GatB/YqeY domain-containing protein [Acetobacter indonesiensis]MCG0994163.1 GatB/YqeY domain-containing protein [Acetobacter indonesiensis]OUI95171.1 aspartyl-tRNA amidotransferase [Acetobacter indonesiensis]OUI95535.1 aspartyl-tRNA amidotransferase [Acetobacter indonesiensis]GAN62961.1 aspartyl/glutamyl-tRNA amidotransferase GatB/YqeY [Acetobacter indonesiensis]GBQ56946.1 amidotransferase GatB/YqeY subunit [Acetobacter indonesiensis NRIC 0313]